MSKGVEENDFIDDDPFEEDLLEGDDDDCMLGPDGQCGMAGSEYCDFECPSRETKA